MPKRGKQFFYASGQVSWPTIGLVQPEGVGVWRYENLTMVRRETGGNWVKGRS
jgi:hypothetical protein